MQKKIFVLLPFIVMLASPVLSNSIGLSAEKLTLNQVFEVQEKLKLLGLETGKPDGLIGKKTRSAVSAFQTKYNLGNDHRI